MTYRYTDRRRRSRQSYQVQCIDISRLRRTVYYLTLDAESRMCWSLQGSCWRHKPDHSLIDSRDRYSNQGRRHNSPEFQLASNIPHPVGKEPYGRRTAVACGTRARVEARPALATGVRIYRCVCLGLWRWSPLDECSREGTSEDAPALQIGNCIESEELRSSKATSVSKDERW